MAAELPGPHQARGSTLLVALAIACALGVSYSNSFQVPFLFDDIPAIAGNASIRNLSNPITVIWPDLGGGVTTSGRPVLNLSFALNFAMGGLDVRGYHMANLAIHCAAALVLFGILRRVFTPHPEGAPDWSGLAVAASAAAIWALHPLQTSAVTYIVQRAESLCGLFYLATIYLLLRATESRRPAGWLWASVASCALAMGTKEVAVTAPLITLLFDRTFVAGSFSNAWSRRKVYYVSLASTWALLIALVLGTESRGETAGLGSAVQPWDYLLTQCWAVVNYVKLAIWPHPLVFDYGTATVQEVSAVWWQGVLLTIGAGLTVWAIVRRPKWGFCGAWFFAILAPSSSFVPVASQTIAEHRMYLPLAAVVVLVFSAAARLPGRRRVFGMLAAFVAVVLGVSTFYRNSDYRSARGIWEDTVRKTPESPRARINLAQVLASEGMPTEALGHLEAALKADPRSADAYYNRGVILSGLERTEEAAAAYASAIQLDPEHVEAMNNLGTLAHGVGDLVSAEQFFRRALEIHPYFARALANLSAVLLDAGRAQEGFQIARKAVDSDPLSAGAAFQLGVACLELGRPTDAINSFERTLELDPRNTDARLNLANLLVESGSFDAALLHFQELIAMRPEMLQARRNAAIILAELGRTDEAIAEFERLAAMAPGEPFFQEQLTRLRQRKQ